MTIFSSTGPNTGDLCIRGNQGFIGIKAGTAAAIPVGWAVLTEPYETDDQSLTAVLGDQGLYDDATTYIYTHSNTTLTAGVYLGVRLGEIEIGTYTRIASVFSHTPFTGGTQALTQPITSMQGLRVELRNEGTTYSVLINGNVLYGLVDASATFGATRRTAGISMERKTSATPVLDFFPPGDYESFRIAGMTMNDYVVPAFAGSGAKMIKVGTTGFDGRGGVTFLGAFPDPAFFDTVDASSGDITVDVNTSKFTVSIAGWYKVELRHRSEIPDNTSPGSSFRHILFRNGTAFHPGCERIAAYNGTDAVWANGLQSVWTVYLEAGDYVQAGFEATNTLTDMFKGEATGKDNYFTIALMTRNLL